MGTQFYVSTKDGQPAIRCTCEDFTCPGCQLQLDLNLRNAADLLGHLGLEPAPWGQIPARWLATACERRLATADIDEEIPSTTHHGHGGCRVITAGRDAGYLRKRTQELLRLARSAGTGWVSWS